MKELLKSRKKIGITIGVGIIIFLALYLIGGGKKTKNEKEIMEDLNSDTSWFQYCELKVDNLTIEKRKTDKKQKTDIIYADIVAENQQYNIQCDLHYRLEYELYNDGWILEHAIPENEMGWEISKPNFEMICSDLYKQEPFFELNDAMFDSLNLEYEDNGQDVPEVEYWVTFDGQQDKENFQVIAKGRFHYILGKNGWEFQEDSWIENAGLIPKQGVDETEAENILKAELDEDVSEIKKVDEYKDYQYQTMSYTYDCYKKYQYLTVVQRYVVEFTFSNASAEWQNIGTTLIEENSEWNVVGHRYGIDYDSASGKRNLSVYINSITNTNFKFTYECSADFWGNRASDTSDFTINGYDYDKISVWIHPRNQTNMMFTMRLDKNKGLMISAVDNSFPSITLIEETPMSQYE